MNRKQKAAAAAVTVVAAAGMVTGTVFESPAELVEDVLPIAGVQQSEEEAAVQEKRQKGPAASVREWVLRLPAAVRMLVAVPLWAIGWVLLTAVSTLWMSAAAPVLSRLLGWLCLAAVLLVVFAISVKAAFPDLRLKQIFRPGNLILLLGVTALFAMADMALPTVWEGYGPAIQTVWRVGATCLLAVACAVELNWQGRRAAAAARRTLSKTEVEEAARALADTVCPPRF